MESQLESKSYQKALAKSQQGLGNERFWPKMPPWPTPANKLNETASRSRFGHFFYPKNRPKSKNMMKFMYIEFKFIEKSSTKDKNLAKGQKHP